MSKIKIIIITSVAWVLLGILLISYYSLNSRLHEGRIDEKTEILSNLKNNKINYVPCTSEFTEKAHKLFEVKTSSVFIKNNSNGVYICLYE